jgi:hypothetical protein
MLSHLFWLNAPFQEFDEEKLAAHFKVMRFTISPISAGWLAERAQEAPIFHVKQCWLLKDGIAE